MNNAPLVSVVVPLYNHATYIQGCLQSIAAQSYAKLELILVDDASTDGSLSIAQKFLEQAHISERFNRIEVIAHPKNQGAHQALNHAIEQSQGAYIAPINSDDEYDVGRIEALVDAAAQNNAEFFFGEVSAIDELGQPQSSSLVEELRTERLFAEAHLPSLEFAFVYRQLAISTGNFFFSPNLFKQVGGFIQLKYCHDWDFALQAIRYTRPIFVPQAKYRYRVHSSNSSSDLGDITHQERNVVLQRYFTNILQEKCLNSFAPCPHHWPLVFENFLKKKEIFRYWHPLTPSSVNAIKRHRV